MMDFHILWTIYFYRKVAWHLNLTHIIIRNLWCLQIQTDWLLWSYIFLQTKEKKFEEEISKHCIYFMRWILKRFFSWWFRWRAFVGKVGDPSGNGGGKNGSVYLWWLYRNRLPNLFLLFCLFSFYFLNYIMRIFFIPKSRTEQSGYRI